jgi:hypothetical protein
MKKILVNYRIKNVGIQFQQFFYYPDPFLFTKIKISYMTRKDFIIHKIKIIDNYYYTVFTFDKTLLKFLNPSIYALP